MGTPATKAKNKYASKNYDRIAVQVKKGERELLQKKAEQCGMSLNAYLINGRRIVYSPGLIDRLRETVEKCGGPVDGLQANKENLEALQRALDPVVKERARFLEYPMELFDPDGESPMVHIRFDEREEELIFRCIEMENELIKRILSLT